MDTPYDLGSRVAWRFVVSGVGDTGVSRLSGLEQLEVLGLAATRISDSSAATLAGLPRLRDLSLSTTRISDSGLETLGEAPRLRNVELTLTATTRIGRLGLSRSFSLSGDREP